MRRYWLLASLTAGSIVGLFLIARALQIPLLEEPLETMRGGGVAAALVGIGLLTADVLLPVPSSGVMVLHGAFFGTVVGTLLSLLGSLGAALVAFAIGRAGERWMVRLVSPEEYERAGRLFDRWGPLAIVASRPIPVVAETVMIVAGASPLAWGRALAAAAAGSVVPAFLFALTGATAASWGSATLVFAGVLLMSGLIWLLGGTVSRKRGGRRPEAEPRGADRSDERPPSSHTPTRGS